MQRLLFTFLLCTLALPIGCEKETPVAAPAAPRVAASKLTVLVIDDAPVAASIKLLRGEWVERSGGQIEITEWTTDELLVATELPADLVIYPSRHVGTLVDRDWLRPVRDSVLNSPDLDLDDMLPVVRNATVRYGNKVYAFSLGEPPLMLAGPASQLNHQFSDGYAKSWELFDRLNLPLSYQGSALKHPRAVELLVRSIAYSRYRSGSAVFFDVESLKPQISSPPFIKAFNEILENNKTADSQSQLTISWPSLSAKDSSTAVAFQSLPPAGRVYNPVRKIWETNESSDLLTFYGFAGRSVSVTRSTRNSASAFKLLTWIMSESISTQLSPRSEATLWFRKSQTKKASKWLARNQLDDQTVTSLNMLLNSGNYYLLPRIPGIDEYLQLLDLAVAKAIAEQQPSEKALEEVAQQWDALTDRYGRDRQRTAYRKHLGLDDSNE